MTDDHEEGADCDVLCPPGIVTRCPLELKLRKLKGGVQWHAVISYKNEYIEFNDPSKVESYVAKGAKRNSSSSPYRHAIPKPKLLLILYFHFRLPEQ